MNVNIRCALRRTADGQWQAIMRTPSGLLVHATVDERAIAAYLGRHLASRVGPGAMSAGLWSGLRKIARKIAKARVLQKVGKAYAAVAKNPYIAKAVGLGVAAYTGIPPGVTETAFRASGKLVGRAAAGKRGARKAIAAITRRARRGDPTAKRALRAIAAQNRLRKARMYSVTDPRGRVVSRFSSAGAPPGTSPEIGRHDYAERAIQEIGYRRPSAGMLC